MAINVKIQATNIFNMPVTRTGAGSGWVIDSNGLIVTNNHVIEGAQTIGVSLSDGRVFPALQVAADPISDLAVIKIAATGLPPVQIGDSSKLKVGMMVITIGNALGEGISMTAGWVSRLGVSISIGNDTLYDLIEISAPINPGNSGGPLIDSLGEVVGITNAKLVASGVEAVGYAISLNRALPLVRQLVRTGFVVRSYLGVSLQTVDEAVASFFGLPVNTGVLIASVVSGSPAEKAGLRPGDVIVAADMKSVTSASDLAQIIGNTPVGNTMVIAFWRGSSQLSARVTTIQNPGQ